MSVCAAWAAVGINWEGGGDVQGFDGVIKNASMAVSLYNKSSYEWNNIARFIDDKGFRPSIRIAQNAGAQAEKFFDRIITYTNFELSAKIRMLTHILQVLKDILAELRKHGRRAAVTVSVGVTCKLCDKTKSVENLKAINSTNIYSYISTYSCTNTVNIVQKPEDSGFNLLKFLGETIAGAIIGKIVDEFLGRINKKPEKNAEGASTQLPSGKVPSSSKSAGAVQNGIGKIQSVLKDTYSNIQGVFSKIGSFGVSAFEKIAKAVSLANIKMQALRVATALSSAAQWLYNTALTACPIMLIIIGVAALIAVIVLLVKHWDDVKKAIAGVWNSIVSIFGNIVAWFKTNVINPILSIIPDWLKKFLGLGDPNININAKATGKPDGSKACGLSYVPFDGYVAELHKGERIMTASENRAYSNPPRSYGRNVSSGGNAFNITINGINKTTDQIMNELVARIKEAANTMGEAVAY